MVMQILLILQLVFVVVKSLCVLVFVLYDALLVSVYTII